MILRRPTARRVRGAFGGRVANGGAEVSSAMVVNERRWARGAQPQRGQSSREPSSSTNQWEEDDERGRRLAVGGDELDRRACRTALSAAAGSRRGALRARALTASRPFDGGDVSLDASAEDEDPLCRPRARARVIRRARRGWLCRTSSRARCARSSNGPRPARREHGLVALYLVLPRRQTALRAVALHETWRQLVRPARNSRRDVQSRAPRRATPPQHALRRATRATSLQLSLARAPTRSIDL